MNLEEEASRRRVAEERVNWAILRGMEALGIGPDQPVAAHRLQMAISAAGLLLQERARLEGNDV